MDPKDHSIVIGGKGVSWFLGKYGYGRTGISWPLFASTDNMAPEKPHKNSKKEPALYGKLTVKGVTLAHFKESCGGVSDKAFSTNPGVPDVAHPIITSNIKLHDVTTTGIVHLDRPDVNLANGGDCVDMDCDAMKKAMIKDLDGTLLGSKGAIIPESEFEWDGDARRGLGDYRIPKSLLVTPDGIRRNISEVRPHKGVIRNSNCIYRSDWPAYECHNLDYDWLVLESMDEDYEIRRLSPVAVRSDTGYLDLLNGPRDVGICHGYACRERMSFFSIIVTDQNHFDIHLTSTTPQVMRLHLPNADPNFAVRVSIYWGLQQVVNAYVNDAQILAENEEMINGQVSYKREGDFLPSYNKNSGSNFFNVTTKSLNVIVRSGEPIVLKLMTNSVILKMGLPPISIDEFFGSNVLKYLQTFLGLSDSQIKVVNVVAEDSTASRRKRAISTLQITIQVGDHALDMTEASNLLSKEKLQNVVDALREGIQTGKISREVGYEITGAQVFGIVPNSNSSDWTDYIKKNELGLPEEYLQVADKLVMVQYPTPLHEGTKFLKHASFKIIDQSGKVVSNLNTANGGTWKVKATLILSPNSDNRAKLIGRTSVPVNNGWAFFNDLGISHSGNEYRIEFSIEEPKTLLEPIKTNYLTIAKRPTKPQAAITGSAIVGRPFYVKFYLTDAITNEAIYNIDWKGHSWKLNFKSHQTVTNPSYVEEIQENIDASLGYLTKVLKFNEVGNYLFTVSMNSTPASDYSAVNTVRINVIPENYVKPADTFEKTVELKFDENFEKVNSSEKLELLQVAFYNDIWRKLEKTGIDNINFKAGSIISTFRLYAETSETLENALPKISDYVEDGCNLNFAGSHLKCFQYMMVDNAVYNDLRGNENFDWKLKVLLPVMLVAVLVVAVVGLIILLLKNVSKRPMSKTRLCPTPDSLSSRDAVKVNLGYDSRPLSRADIDPNWSGVTKKAWEVDA